MNPITGKDHKCLQVIALSQALRDLEELYRSKSAAFSGRIKKENHAQFFGRPEDSVLLRQRSML